MPVNLASTGGGSVTIAAPSTASSLTATLPSTTGVLTNAADVTSSITSSFTGSNQSLAATGYQKLPGGLIIQWGTSASVGADSSGTVTYPIAFTTAVYSVTITGFSTIAVSGQGIQTVNTITTTNFIISNGQDTAMTFKWIAIGV